VGEIAEALKRSRDERDAQQSTTGSEPARQPSAPAPPGRSELLAALEQARRSEDQAPVPAAEASAGVDVAEAPPAERVYELDETAIDSFGKVDMHRQLALQVAAQLEARPARSLAVVSAMRDEGKTTVACTLAMALASVTAHRSVALVDLDLRNPSVGRRLRLGTTVGIEQFLLGRVELDAIRVPIKSPELDVYPSIEPHRAAHELLARPRLGHLIRELERRYATVIIDTPPTLVVPDASLLLKQGPCCVTVARSGVSRVRRFQEMLDILPPEAIVGKVLNSAALPSRDKSYYEYSYGVEEDPSEDEA
jgi:Mrp family chromosome partitioning ATPase